MNSNSANDLKLLEKVDKCRLCWSDKKNILKLTAITSSIEKSFFELTQIEVKNHYLVFYHWIDVFNLEFSLWITSNCPEWFVISV